MLLRSRRFQLAQIFSPSEGGVHLRGPLAEAYPERVRRETVIQISLGYVARLLALEYKALFVTFKASRAKNPD